MECLDFRTLPCPQPVVQCRKFLAENIVQKLQVLVDNEAAVENVTRYLELQGFYVHKDMQEGNFLLTAEKNVFSEVSAQTPPLFVDGPLLQDVEELAHVKEKESILVFITTDTLGRGDDVLGAKLMNSFLATLPELGTALWRVVLLNGGVTLAASTDAEKSDAMKHLQTLEQAGVDVLVCGACLQHYGLLEHKKVGETSNMLDIVTSLELASKVIRP